MLEIEVQVVIRTGYQNELLMLHDNKFCLKANGIPLKDGRIHLGAMLCLEGSHQIQIGNARYTNKPIIEW